MTSAVFIKADLSYDDVPWYRKRWFVVLSLLLFMPATIVVALTGDLYAKRNDGIYRYSEKQKKTIVLVAALFLTVGIVRIAILG